MMISGVFRRIPAIWSSGFLTILIVVFFLSLSATAYAEEIIYTGDGKNLRDTPSWLITEFFEESLVPGNASRTLSSGNKVTISYDPSAPGMVDPQVVFGGLSELEDTVNNQVILLHGKVHGAISGGLSYKGNAAGNTVTMSGGYVGRKVYGGLSSNGDATGNTAVISGGIVEESLLGGFSEAGSATGNSVTVNAGEVDYVYGGWSFQGDAKANTAAINGGTVYWSVYGGWSHKGSVTDNTVTVKEGEMDFVYGGWTELGGVADNRVFVSGGTVVEDVYGGLAITGKGLCAGNAVTISGGNVKGRIIGGRSENSDSTGNVVNISGGEIEYLVVGGRSEGGNAAGNIINISDGSVANEVFGGSSKNGNSMNNVITISGGNITGRVFGGWSLNGAVSGNKITISGGSAFISEVTGGRSENGNTTSNTITINGRPNLTKTYMYGGYTENSRYDAVTGNTLNLQNSSITASGIYNFEYYNFDLPKGLADGAVMLSVTDPVDLKGTTVAISLQDGCKLNKGDKVALIKSAKGVSAAPKNKSCKTKHDGTLYEFSIYTDKNNLWAKVTKISSAAK